MATVPPDSPTPRDRLNADNTPSPLGRYGSTNSEQGGDEAPSPSFADLGIPTGPKLAYSPSFTGKRRPPSDFSKLEICFLLICGLALLATTGFTIYKLVTVERSEPDFVFALVIIVKLGFCYYYLFHGIFEERPYEIFILAAATTAIVIYLITSFVNGINGTIELVRLICACVMGPVVVGMGLWIGGRKFAAASFFVFRSSKNEERDI